MSLKTKVCKNCGIRKPLGKFFKNAKLKDGHRSWCKTCERPMQQNSMLVSKFGITLKEYNDMFDAQNGVCAVCGLPERRTEGPEVSERLCVDHDHKTGKIRVLLCRTCNSALGLVNDDVSILLKCMEYLVRNASS